MEKIRRFFECLVPISKCNLYCSYCYVIQGGRRDIETTGFPVSPEQMGLAFAPERVGGSALISLCGFGETLIPVEMPEIIYNILKHGQYVNVTNNGTMTKRFEEIMKLTTPEMRSRLLFSFSLHYIELKNRDLLSTFISNVKYVKECGCSILVQVNLCDEYIPLLDEIKDMCMKEFGAYPQIALTRRETNGKTEIMTNMPQEDFISIAKSFESPLFDFTLRNFKVKRTEFCYAGAWSYAVDLETGIMKSCYCSKPIQNIFEDIDKPIKCMPIGNCCQSAYCTNSTHFMSLGVIPSLDTPSYAELRNRSEAQWFQPQMFEFLSHQLSDDQPEFSAIQKLYYNSSNKISGIVASVTRMAKRIIRGVLRRMRNVIKEDV